MGKVRESSRQLKCVHTQRSNSLILLWNLCLSTSFCYFHKTCTEPSQASLLLVVWLKTRAQSNVTIVAFLPVFSLLIFTGYIISWTHTQILMVIPPTAILHIDIPPSSMLPILSTLVNNCTSCCATLVTCQRDLLVNIQQLVLYIDPRPSHQSRDAPM